MIYFTVDKDGYGKLQLSINSDKGHGYRIHGPKYIGASKELMRHPLDRSDIDHIRAYLNEAAKRIKAC